MINKNSKIFIAGHKGMIGSAIMRRLKKLKYKNLFYQTRKELDLTNHNVKINYENKGLLIKGKGNILFQNKRDLIDYSIRAKNKIYKFNSSLIIKNNPIYIESINFKNNEDIETKINLKGTYDQKNRIQFKLISLKDESSEILAKNIILDNENRFIDMEFLKLDYYDADNLKNSAKINKKNKEYFLDGSVLNFDNLIENLLNSDDQNNLKISNKKFKFNINLKKTFCQISDFIIFILLAFFFFNDWFKIFFY